MSELRWGVLSTANIGVAKVDPGHAGSGTLPRGRDRVT